MCGVAETVRLRVIRAVETASRAQRLKRPLSLCVSCNNVSCVYVSLPDPVPLTGPLHRPLHHMHGQAAGVRSLTAGETVEWGARRVLTRAPSARPPSTSTPLTTLNREPYSLLSDTINLSVS